MSSIHFTDAELSCTHCNANGTRQGVFDLLEDIRSRAENHYGIGRVRIHVDSGYRCPAHNAEVGGAKQSQHLKGNAADIVIEVKQDRGREKFEWVPLPAALAEPIALESPLIGGLGRSMKAYIHCDIRDRINGAVTKWCYDEHNKEIAYFEPGVKQAAVSS